MYLAGSDDGGETTRLDAMKQIKKQLGRWPKEFKDLKCPDRTKHLFHIFLDIVSAGGFSFLELKAYLDLKQIKLSIWETELLNDMNIKRLKHG